MPAPPSKSSSSDRHAYIPAHVEQAMTKQMQQMMPAHMKQYVGPYMQQNVMNQGGMMSAPGKPTAPPSQYRPVTSMPRESHYHQYTQPKSTLSANLPGTAVPTQPVTTNAPSPVPLQPAATPNQYEEHAGLTPGQPNYDFIMDHGEPPKKSGLPGGGGSSAFGRGIILAGGLLVLLVVFVVLKGLLSSPSAFPSYVSITQSQQELVQLTTSALEQPSLTDDTRNFAATAQLSIATSQAKLIQYLADSGQAVDVKQLTLKIDPAVDKRLETAAAATTYNATFQEIMKAKLIDYTASMQKTYDQFKAPKGQALLSNDYKQAQLMLDQLNQTTN